MVRQPFLQIDSRERDPSAERDIGVALASPPVEEEASDRTAQTGRRTRQIFAEALGGLGAVFAKARKHLKTV